MHQNPHTYSHQPVLLDETVKLLDPQKGESYLDVTAGYGGHAQAILKLSANYQQSVLVDRDAHAISELRLKFSDSGISLIHQDYLSASQELKQAKRQFDMIVADLGVSSPHLNEAGRGFSFSESAKLDMRMDQRQTKTAWDIVNLSSETELADIIQRFGEEPKARRMAHLIVDRRPINNTSDLADVAKKVWPVHSRTHPATRLFQAIRIAVNDELSQLNSALDIWLELLAPGGRIVIISFHSLEDRIVKRYLKSQSGDRYDARLQLLVKRPLKAAPHEIAHNPRSRSAKLRAAVKQK